MSEGPFDPRDDVVGKTFLDEAKEAWIGLTKWRGESGAYLIDRSKVVHLCCLMHIAACAQGTEHSLRSIATSLETIADVMVKQGEGR